jgi:hypothetical protein
MIGKRNYPFLITFLVLLISMQVAAVAKGFPKFPITGALLVAGNEIKPGDCEIQWKSGSPETEVTFIINNKVAAKVQGKIVNINPASKYYGLVTVPDSSGRQVIKEIRLQDKTFKIVFE